MFQFVITLVLLVLAPSCAQAATRVALVIGNSAYEHTPRLENPKHDASDIAATLKKLGFEVVAGFDLNKADFDRKVREFSEALRGAEVGVFFYAGHGIQVAGQNYLVPIDAQLSTPAALELEMMKVEVVHRIMERLTKTNVLFLDACRDNPLSRNLARNLGTRSTEIGKGLAQIEAGSGTLISFSTHPGAVASDGAGRNSPYAGALVKYLSSSNDDLNAILIAVRNDVMIATREAQVPWEHSALRGRFYFNPTSQAADPAKVAPARLSEGRLSEAAEAWGATKETTTVAILEAYIARYRETFYAELARARIEELKKQQLAVVRPPPTAPPSGGDWFELGCQQVSLTTDRGSVMLGRRSERFGAVRLHIRGGSVEMLDVRLIYTNREQQDIPVRDVLRGGERSRSLDITGGERSIERLEMIYRSVPPQSGGLLAVCVEGRH